MTAIWMMAEVKVSATREARGLLCSPFDVLMHFAGLGDGQLGQPVA